MACKYRRGTTWYLKYKIDGVWRWTSTNSASSRVADDYLRLVKRGQEIPELKIPAANKNQNVGVQTKLPHEQLIVPESITSEYLANSVGIALSEWSHLPALERISMCSRELITVELLADAWIEWGSQYYVNSDGTLSGEMDAIRACVIPLKDLYGKMAASRFGPLAFKAVRNKMIAKNLVRTTINKQCGRIRRCFRWGVENEYIPSSVLEGLRAVAGLRSGRSEAREKDPIMPVPEDYIARVLAIANRPICAMISLQLLTAARPGEIVRLRPSDFDCSGHVWTAVLNRHKTAHKGRHREIFFGPKAQEILKPFMNRNAHDYLFSPTEAHEERFDLDDVPQEILMKRAQLKKRDRQRAPGKKYSEASYRRAVVRICEAIIEGDLEQGELQPQMGKWTPNRLRHNAATTLRKNHGLEAAQVILGHAKADITQVYAEVDKMKAIAVVSSFG